MVQDSLSPKETLKIVYILNGLKRRKYTYLYTMGFNIIDISKYIKEHYL